MKNIITQVGTYITGDDVADAVAKYWLALTEDRRADVVDIPIVGPSGGRSRVRLALGAMLPLAIVDAEPVHKFDDDGAADLLLARARSLSPSTGLPFAPDDIPCASGGYDSPFL